MDQTNQKYREIFLNKTIDNIRFYNINENYMVFDPEHKWVIEVGIEIVMGGKLISFAWNSEMLLYDITEGEITDLTGELNIFEIDFSDHENILNLKGKIVRDVILKWSWYQEMDDEMEIKEEKIYIPQEIRLETEDGQILQIATVVFKLKDFEMKNLMYDSQSMMLVTLNQPVEILEPEPSPEMQEEDEE
ncbi:MAG: hypothetical protein U0W24_06260 [Bacteroidales bacterium]